MDTSPFNRLFEPESNYDMETDSDDEDRRLLERFLTKERNVNLGKKNQFISNGSSTTHT